MFRTPRQPCLHGAGPALRATLRCYTPIISPEPPADRLNEMRTQDERRTLWAASPPVPDLPRAVEMWLRFGNDPVVHTMLPAPIPYDPRMPADRQLSRKSTSPFAFVEDYMGTNLVFDRPEHVKESVEVWTNFFERHYIGRMRQSRRTSANFLGQATTTASGAAAAGELLTDEADQPGTKWGGDTYFSEVAYLSERHLKEKVTNMEQLERALWERAGPEAFDNFFEAVQQQTSFRIPLPVASVWYLEGEARKQWVERFLPIVHASREFFETTLAPVVKQKGSPEAILTGVAAALAKVNAVHVQRVERQVKAGIRPDWSIGAAAADEGARALWCENEIEKEQRSMMKGSFDPEDLLDSSEGWAAEHAAIEAIVSAPIEGCGITLQDFWLHTTRREAIETQHILEEERLREVAAATRNALYREHSLQDIQQSCEEAVRRGVLDIRAASFKPHFNAVWCKLNYVKFGSSSTVQHTHTASRQLLFHYAASVQEVKATADLYYATKPLSSLIDYASPYTMRRSLARLCAAYGLDMAHAAQRPQLISASYLARAEDMIGAIAKVAAVPFGKRRRAREVTARAANQRLLCPVSEVQVRSIAAELLESGAPEELLEATDGKEGVQPAISMWPLGSKQAVHYRWATPHLDRLRAVTQAGPMTAERATELQAIRRRGRLEVSLWRKQGAAEIKAARDAAADAEKACATAAATTPALRQVQAYAENLYKHLSGDAVAAGGAGEGREKPQSNDGEADGEWVFAVMLDDNAPLTLDERVEVYLPYCTSSPSSSLPSPPPSPLPQGEYRVRVRAYDVEADPSGSPRLCSEAFSAPFPVFDALPQLVEQFFSKEKGGSVTPEVMAGGDLIPFCDFLRVAGLDVPLRCEFDAGQAMDAKGNLSLPHLLESIRGTEFHRSDADCGITEAQRGIESKCRAHWELYNPGATEEEWAVARRAVLDRAMRSERDWWLADPLLEVSDIATASSNGDVEAMSYPAMARYGAELCTALEAAGQSGTGGGAATLSAECSVDGTGALTSLTFGGGAAVSAADVSTEAALAAALTAVQSAQTRHSTLSMFKRGPMEKQAQVMLFCGVQGLEFGGKYGRTYCYAADKAKAEIAETYTSGRVPTKEVAEASRERVSEQESPDRFASQTHPEQRKTRFRPRVTLSGANMEDPSPDQTTSWGR